VLNTTEYGPSNGRDGAKNTTSFLTKSKDVTVAATGTGDLGETSDTKTSEAVIASKFEQNIVTIEPPDVETTDGETKSMVGSGRAFGSKQYVSEQESSTTGCCKIFKS